eukprot:NODE_294_length_1004_cov_466.050171_g287_i0.p1 GENE.NODE_294_length_1004_cov_466.050171_g287_i0~~NODE_294_length_1004_cov_466.050171_g287_i0.p1  ORF type:complete len:234 (-),score=64.84 NODE_294_length_1004_cov_466.050171_g287_i0:236-937(-)
MASITDIPGCTPHWSIPRRGKVSASRGGLSAGFADFYNSPPPEFTTLGRRHYLQQTGQEAEHKMHKRIIPQLPPMDTRRGGKKVIQHTVNQNCFTSKAIISGPPSGIEDNRLFKPTHKVTTETGEPMHEKRSKEFTLESYMTKKKRLEPPKGEFWKVRKEFETVAEAENGFLGKISKPYLWKQYQAEKRTQEAIKEYFDDHPPCEPYHSKRQKELLHAEKAEVRDLPKHIAAE